MGKMFPGASRPSPSAHWSHFEGSGSARPYRIMGFMPGATGRAIVLLAIVSVLGVAGPASAQVPIAAAWLSRDLGGIPFRADYRFTFFPEEPVSGQNADLGYLQHELWLTGPVWQNDRDEL